MFRSFPEPESDTAFSDRACPHCPKLDCAEACWKSDAAPWSTKRSKAFAQYNAPRPHGISSLWRCFHCRHLQLPDPADPKHVLGEPSRTDDLQRSKPCKCRTDLPGTWHSQGIASLGQSQKAILKLRAVHQIGRFSGMTANCDGSGCLSFASDHPNTLFNITIKNKQETELVSQQEARCQET